MNIVVHMPLWQGSACFCYSRVLYLDLKEDLFPIFWGTTRMISGWLCHFAIPPAMEKCSTLSTLSPICAVLEVLISPILIGVRCNLMVVLICISLITKDNISLGNSQPHMFPLLWILGFRLFLILFYFYFLFSFLWG